MCEDFVKVLSLGDLHAVVVLASWFWIPRTSLPVLERSHTPRTGLPERENGLSSPCHSSELTAGFSRNRLPALVKTQFRPNSWFSQTVCNTRIQPRGRDCFALKFLDTKHAGLDFAITGSLFFGPSILSSLRHGVWLFSWKKMDARKHREIHDVEQTKKMVPFITRETTSWSPKWLCQPTNLTQLCGFWTRVSSSDFCPLWSFWSLLHYPRKYAAELRIERNLRLWQRDPNLTIYQHLDYFVFQNCVLGFVLRISLRTMSPCVWCVGVCSSKNVTLLSPHPIIKCRNSVHSETSIQRNNLRFGGTVRHWRLLLAHPTCGNSCSSYRKYIRYAPTLT